MTTILTKKSGPQVVYEGSQAGLQGQKGKGGDANSAFDYTVYCSCVDQTEGPTKGQPTCLGPIGRFTPNAAGLRTCYCPRCGFVTILDKQAQIQHHVPFNTLKAG